MRSMTGYGRASLLRDGRELTLELKTVNHRFLDLNIRLPRQLLFLEDCLRKGLNARLARGHVDVFINYRNTREDAREVCLDGALLQAYAGALEKAAALLPQVHDDRSLMRLVMMPERPFRFGTGGGSGRGQGSVRGRAETGMRFA